MRARTARRKAAKRWVRRNRPPIDARLPSQVVRYVLLPMLERDGDLTDCPWFRGTGTCSKGCWQEPSCQTDSPLYGWPRDRMERGLTWPSGWWGS